MRTDRRQLLCAAGSLAFVGCTGSGGGDSDERSTTETATSGGGGAAADATVTMKNTAFRPSKATVDAGATVEWVNEDQTAHTVTSTTFHDVAASWEMDARVSDGSVTHTFEEEGVYEYYCTIHGKDTMCGVVLVGGATLDRSLPCGGSGDGGGGYY